MVTLAAQKPPLAVALCLADGQAAKLYVAFRPIDGERRAWHRSSGKKAFTETVKMKSSAYI